MIVRIFFRRLHTRWDVMSPTSSTCNETQTKKYQRMNVIVKPLSISHYVSRYLVVCRRHWSVMKDGQYMKINVKLLLRCYLLVVLIVCRARYWPSVTVNILHCKLMLIDHRICCWQRKRHERHDFENDPLLPLYKESGNPLPTKTGEWYCGLYSTSAPCRKITRYERVQWHVLFRRNV